MSLFENGLYAGNTAMDTQRELMGPGRGTVPQPVDQRMEDINGSDTSCIGRQTAGE